MGVKTKKGASNYWRISYCGDGVLQDTNGDGVSEKCDDGNNENGDGCDQECQVETGCFAPIDTMLVIDKSGSMSISTIEGGKRLTNTKSANINYLNSLNFSKYKVGLSSFNQIASLNQGLTNNKATITNAINALVASGQTNIGDGISVGRAELIANGRDKKVMILVSDGPPNARTPPPGVTPYCFVNPTSPNNCTIYAVNQSNITKASGIEIFTIGIGVSNTFAETVLKEIATTPFNYYSAPNSTVLDPIYNQIANKICPK